MILSTLTRDEILGAIAIMTAQSLPDNIDGDVEAAYNDEDGIDVFFIPIYQESKLLN